MLDQLRRRIETYLFRHQVCVLTTAGAQGAWATPARYRPLLGVDHTRGPEVICLLPRWSDAAYYLEQNPAVLLIVQDTNDDTLRWLAYWGAARLVAAPAWAGLLPEAARHNLAVQVTPVRIDLFDESQGWGARESLEW